MVEGNSADSPLNDDIGTAGPEVTDAFELLGNETRLAILLALWEGIDYEKEGSHVLSFSELRDWVGLSDSGQFNYHLGKLTGSYINQSDNGYYLNGAGRAIVHAVIAGAGVNNTTAEPKIIDVPCEYCGAPTVVGYMEESVYRACTQCEEVYDREGTFAEITEEFGRLLFATEFEPAGVADRTPREIFEAVIVKFKLNLAMHMAGVCSRCSGTVETTLHYCEDHETSGDDVCATCGNRRGINPVLTCTVCKYLSNPGPYVPLSFNSEVIEFFADHGVDIGDITDSESLLRGDRLLQNQEAELISTDPPRVQVTIRYEGDSLGVIYDEQLNVIEVNEGD